MSLRLGQQLALQIVECRRSGSGRVALTLA